jgi:serine/threonine protein kinase/tetratricopeptide (TPR) repeat protein
MIHDSETNLDDTECGGADQSDPDRNPIDVLAEQFTRQCREGLRPSIEDFAKRYPEQAQTIRELFPSIEAIEQLGSHAESEKRFAKDNAFFDREQIEQIGDYRIVREVGRGGMGIVYEAIQQSLGRHVAIKLLLQRSTSPKHVQRFEREARTAANLHHTNIVQVFGVGSQDGFHYYVMQLIDGVGLDRVIEELRATRNDDPTQNAGKGFRNIHSYASGYDNVAKIGKSVAEALQHAHDHGTLHRDIKPANLLLGGEGSIWVTDFGLAKAMEDTEVSRTGEVIGTLRFMAPEQFAGKPDPRSDIYSLGLTIYELLTLQPAWDEKSRSHLLEKADARGHRIVPASKHDSGIPRDLDTIVMKACARDPDDRYQTAAALAEDLENFLEGRPIKARPPYSFEVFVKWCRRNPAIAALSGIAALLLTLVAVTTSIGYVRTNAALKREKEEQTRTEIARRAAELEKQKAENTLGISLDALDRIYKRFVPDQISSVESETVAGIDGEQLAIPTQAMLTPETAALLEDVLGFYDKFAHQDSDNLHLKREAAKANRRVGDIHRKLGHYDKSVQAYDNAVIMYRQMGDSDFEIAKIQTALGNVFRENDERDLSHAAFFHSKRLLEKITESRPESVKARYELARTLYLLAKRKPHDPGNPGQLPPPGNDQRSRQNGGPPPGPGGRRATPDPAPELIRAIEILEQLRLEHAGNPDYQFLLALCIRERDMGPGVRGEKATELLRDLCERYPNQPDYQLELAESLSRVPIHGLGAAETDDSIVRLRQAVACLKSLVESHQNVMEYRKTKAHSLHKLGTLLRMRAEFGEDVDSAKMDEALEYLQSAVVVQKELCSEFDAPSYVLWLSRMQQSLAEALLQNNDPKKALELIENSIMISSQLSLDVKRRDVILHTLITQHDVLSNVLESLGRNGEASAARETSHEFRNQLHERPMRR